MPKAVQMMLGDGTVWSIFVLTDDGSVWGFYIYGDKSKWVQYDPWKDES